MRMRMQTADWALLMLIPTAKYSATAVMMMDIPIYGFQRYRYGYSCLLLWTCLYDDGALVTCPCPRRPWCCYSYSTRSCPFPTISAAPTLFQAAYGYYHYQHNHDTITSESSSELVFLPLLILLLSQQQSFHSMILVACACATTTLVVLVLPLLHQQHHHDVTHHVLPIMLTLTTAAAAQLLHLILIPTLAINSPSYQLSVSNMILELYHT
jgi:hypothetical protein